MGRGLRTALMRSVALGAVLCAALGASADKPPPHMVLILADDFGWHNVGFHQETDNPEVRTENMDRLVEQGLLLDRAYAYKICSPSRSSLQTGRLPVHVNVVNTAPEVFNPDDTVSGFAGIPRNMTGIAARLREAGYRTHMAGKWDVGMATEEHTPRGRGYESSLFYFHHANSYWTYGLPFQSTGEVNVCLNQFTDLSDDNHPGKAFVTEPQTYEEEWFTERSLRTIEEHDPAEPLFLFHSFHIVHTPLQVPAAYEEAFNFIPNKGRRLVAAMVHYMDEVIGALVSTLKRKGMWDNTLLWFMSDNGGPIYKPASANNFPLLGGKYSDWEGGVRVNAFVSGGWVPPSRRGKVVKDYVHIADVYSTLLALAGLDPADRAAAAAGLPPVDGVDQSGVLLGHTSNARTEIHLSELALIQGPFKLVTGAQPMTGRQGPFYPNNTGPEPTFLPKGWVSDVCASGCLFNILDDPSEEHDLAARNASLLASMQARLSDLNAGNFNPDRGQPTLKACLAAVLRGGFYGPFLTAHDLRNPHDALRSVPAEWSNALSEE